ncbi:MAG: hypothetical protein EBR82_20415 [Caulobacteraceae bacterium]|nr:hypothetical protein [Caulobacteraceae bacterium]
MRDRICWALVGSHLFAIFFSAIAIGPRSFEDALDVILLITPLTGAYLMIIVQYFVGQNAAVSDEVVIGKTAADLFTVLTAAFGAALIGVLYLSWNGDLSMELLKRSVGVIETVLGVYVSLFVKMLFGGDGAAQPVP